MGDQVKHSAVTPEGLDSSVVHMGEYLKSHSQVTNYNKVRVIIIIYNILYSALYNWTTITLKHFTDKRSS